MSRCARIEQTFLPLLGCLFILTASLSVAQESAPPPVSEENGAKLSAPESSASEKPSLEKSAEQKPTEKLEGLVTETPSWAVERKDGNFEDYVPAVTDPYYSYDQAKLHMDYAIVNTFAEHLDRKLRNLALAKQLTPDASELRKRFTLSSPWVVIKETVDGKDTYRGAIRLDIPDHEINFIVEDYHRRRQQFAAVGQTVMVGAGMLGLVFILAVSARLDHAFGGRRSGILRAASTVAILSLFVGLFITAVLGRIFTS